MAFYVSVPEGPFEILDNGPVSASGMQPFAAGELFEQGAVFNNRLASGRDLLGLERQWMEYAVILGPVPSGRSQKGSGVVASFKLRCVGVADGANVSIDDTALRETRLVLPDGTSERPFVKTEGLQISVLDFELDAENHPTATSASTWGRVKDRVHD
jgi:hypothetical protein